MRTVMCFDPSGNHSEGDGTTGWAVFVDGELRNFGDVAASDYHSPEMYWSEVGKLIEIRPKPDLVVCESFKLFAHKSKQQAWSEMETPQLIGYLRMVCWTNAVPLYFQDPKDKVRVADPILEHMGVIEKRGQMYYCMGRKTNLHMRDAIRHGVFFHRYNKEKVTR